MEVMEFIVVILCGFGIGALSGMFGIGGGGMIVPLLYIVFNLPIVAAASTSLLTIAPTGISGSIKHILQKTASIKTGLVIGGSGALASVGGSLIAGSLPSYLIIILTVTVIIFSVGMMLRTLLRDKALGTGSELLGSPLREEVPRRGAAPLVLPLIIGLIAGGIAGIVGVGGGFIIVPFCVAFLGYPLKKAAGTSLIAISLIATPAIIAHALLGHIWWLYGVAIMIGSIPGAQLGSWLIARLPERPMRFAFAGLLTLLGVLMLAQEFFL
ncbi:MAG: sulfite exporter TauE/SafE family protein [Coriobacteriales bacterium]|jgi:uncharacterized membrane protein YfcA|nr:sulfite exporter TauE/SafE family protein [Coriobacteriales bacterium]